MSYTNFAALTASQKRVWSLELWKLARDASFVNRFMGNENAPIHRITELTKTSKGDRAVITLVADLLDDGVTGDNQRNGNEEAMASYECEITIDSISHSVKSEGEMAEQKSIVAFRQNARDRLKIWLADRIDQMFFLAMAGISYDLMPNGAKRKIDSKFPNLAFAADVTPPSSKRSLMWDGNNLHPCDTASIDASFKPSYNMLVDAAAYAKEHHIKPLRADGKEYFIVLMHPQAMAMLRKDPDYKDAVINAGERGSKNPIFTGGIPTVNGLILHEHNKVFNTKGAAAGSKWGEGGLVNGTRNMILGAQAMAHIDLEAPKWVEEKQDYENQLGINVTKKLGFLKPKFYSPADSSVQDFGGLAIDTFIQ